MPESDLYKTERFAGSERHEVCFGSNRKRSIEDGLVVFLTPEQHRGTYGIHGKHGATFDRELKEIGQQAWQDYYNKTADDFREKFGKSYI